MIIWSGVGFLAGVLALCCCFAMEAGLEMYHANDLYYQQHGWPKFVALLIAAAMVWPLGRLLNRKEPDRTYVDQETGETVTVKSYAPHTFFFIPMEYWAPILVVIGVIMAFT